MANHDNDPDRIPDSYGLGDPVDAAPRLNDSLHGTARSSEPIGSAPSRAGAMFISVVLLALVIAGASWLIRSAPEQPRPGTSATPGFEAAPDAGVPGVVGTPGATVGAWRRADRH